MYEISKDIILLKTMPATTINHRLFMLKVFYTKGLIIEHSITKRNISKTISQYTTDVNNEKVNKISKLKKTY